MSCQDVLCEQALELFVSGYGSEAGNLALKTLCFGGLYVAGGIAPKILPAMTDPALFYANVIAKGRMQSLLSAIPVFIVTHPQVGLLGSQVMALRLMEAEGKSVKVPARCDDDGIFLLLSSSRK
jgi:glucokinase